MFSVTLSGVARVWLRGDPSACRPQTSWLPTNSTLICRLSFCARGAGSMAPRVSCADNGYCWSTPKCRNLGAQHAFFEGKKAEETAPRKSTLRTLKRGCPTVSGRFLIDPTRDDRQRRYSLTYKNLQFLGGLPISGIEVIPLLLHFIILRRLFSGMDD